MFAKGKYVRHIASGKIYRIIHTARTTRLEASGEPAYVYRSATRLGPMWVRAASEMEDGRFESYEYPFPAQTRTK